MNEDKPERIFFDTCIINFIADHHDVIFLGTKPSDSCTPEDIKDLAGLQRILGVRSGTNYHIAVSPFTYAEVMDTPDQARKDEQGFGPQRLAETDVVLQEAQYRRVAQRLSLRLR